MKERDIELIAKKVDMLLSRRLDISYDERENMELLEVENKDLKKEIEMLRGNLKKVCDIAGLDIRCVECDRFVVSRDCEEINQELLVCKNNHVPF